MIIAIFSLAGVPVSYAASKSLKAKITQQPAAGTVELGQSVELQVAYSSATTATCQWRRNKVPLSGATDTTYVIDSVLPEDAGKYDVVITNAAGATTSRTVVLEVNIAPLSLPVDTVLYGNFTMRVAGESVSSDGAYLVTGATTLQDPEAPTDSYTFIYTRQPKNKAKLVINGHFYDSDLGDYITSQETYTLTFTGVSPEGELLATASAKGVFIAPEGYRPSKLNFTAQGTITIQLPESGVPVSGSSLGGTLTLAGGNLGGVSVTNVSTGSLTKTGSGSLTLGEGTLAGSDTYSATSTVTLSGAQSGLYPGAISSTLALVTGSIVNTSTLGAGSLTLTGSNTYTGTSTITYGGSLSLGTASLVDTSTFLIGGANLLTLSSGVLDFSGVESLGSYSFSSSVTDGIPSLMSIESVGGATTP